MKNYLNYNKEIIQYAINWCEDLKGADLYVCDLHNEIFNTSYFIIGTNHAERWLYSNIGIFNAINDIKEYENSNFGSINTDLSNSERVVNMYVYIKGEEIFNELDTIRKNWDNRIDDEILDNIIAELKEML